MLLVAIIAAIALTLRQRKDSKHIDPSQQVRVQARDRLQIIKMPPVAAGAARSRRRGRGGDQGMTSRSATS